MADLLIERLCQLLGDKLQAAPTAGMNDLIAYLRNVIEADRELKGALTDKAVQINQGDATGYQVLVEGGSAYIRQHLHVSDPGMVKTVINIILQAYLIEDNSSMTQNNYNNATGYQVKVSGGSPQIGKINNNYGTQPKD